MVRLCANGAGLLVTSHKPGGLPLLLRTAVDADLAAANCRAAIGQQASRVSHRPRRHPPRFRLPSRQSPRHALCAVRPLRAAKPSRQLAPRASQATRLKAPAADSHSFSLFVVFAFIPVHFRLHSAAANARFARPPAIRKLHLRKPEFRRASGRVRARRRIGTTVILFQIAPWPPPLVDSNPSHKLN